MIKRKNIVLGLLAAILIAIASLFCFGDSVNASAASYSSGRYRLDIDLVYQVMPNISRDFEAYLSGSTSATNVSGTISDGDVLKFSPKKLEIVIPAGSANQWHTQYARIYNVKLTGPSTFASSNYNEGSTSESVNVSFTLSNLSDGNYTLSFESQIYYRANNSGGWRDPTTTTFSFKVDTSAPVISGASASITGKYTNTAFTVRAADSGSGVSAMYMKSPTSSSYVNVGSSKTVSSGSANGLYRFYATDKAGWKSSTYYIYYDNIAPTGKITSESGNNLTSGNSTEEGFSFTASDSGSGINTVMYKTPSAISWANYTQGTVVKPTAEQGLYRFRVGDKSGNVSTYEITLYAPCANGHTYISEVIAPTCTTDGYTTYTCTECGNSYTDNVTQALGHNYVTTTKEATCTEYGMTVYTCQICGDSHSDVNGVYPTGHNYSNSIVKAATCTQDGERRYVCDKCGDEYTEVIPAMGHNYAITDSSSENGITTRVYTCTLCSDSYTQELGDQYEEVSSYIEELFNQYRPYMWWVLLATAGIWSIVMGVFFAIAQKNEDKEKAKKMIVNYFVGLVVIFAILVACPYLIRGIAVLIT